MVTSVLAELVKPPPPSGIVPAGQVAAACVWRREGFVTTCDWTTL